MHGDKPDHKRDGAAPPARGSGASDDSRQTEDAWIEVVRTMDAVYAELLESQVELEEKNNELEEAQEFISSVLSSMSDILIVCDAQGDILQVNQALEQATGQADKDMVGTQLAALFSEADREMIESVPEAARLKRTIDDREVHLRGPDESFLPYSVNCTARMGKRGRMAGFVLTGRPLGELRKAFKELDQAHKNLRDTQQRLIFSEKMAALGRLVAGVAHELNNPISFVFGNMHALKNYGHKITSYLEALDERPRDDEIETLRQKLQIARVLKDLNPLVDGTLEGAERISEIVQELRRFSGSQKEGLEEFLLEPVVRTAAKWVLQGAKKPPRVRISCPVPLVVRAKKGYVHQIAVNLIQNALDMMDKVDDPCIAVNMDVTDGNARLRVSDNGPGIKDMEEDHIFEPFYTTKPIGKGTGLGLYISYNMAAESGCSLSYDGPVDGGGAAFSLTLPLVSAAGEGM